ncbi:choice-of-anchor D domain-containing protein [uncultured Marivirga sp.]|uniref:Ig-like domain-containing protein n=1 Tax=uncultured Marivirga sp. TaxID=1123707 RepID=UPI0030EBB887|tara:strand:- start:168407 stop:175648 length:7242 start_codon:yes stop_codon:yes gene_type:complete
MRENHYIHQIFSTGHKFTVKNRLFITSILLLFLSLWTAESLVAQGAEKRPAEPIICPAKDQDMFTRINIPESSGEFQRIAQNNATAEFEITFGPGAQANPDAMAAFEYALDIWATQIVSSVPIKIYAEFANLGTGVLASAGPAYNVLNFPGAPEQNTLYPAALANALAGEVLFPDEDFDLIVNLGNGIPWYFGLDGNTPAGQYDFVTVALHEAGHGLGFTTVRSFSGGVGSLRSNGNPAVYGLFIEDGDGNLLLDFPDPSTEVGDAFTGGDIFMGGNFAVSALNGQRPELYAPANFQGGSSIAHWDEAAFPAGDLNSLMTPQVGSAESNFDIGDITRGLFKDMGWQINEAEASPVVSNINSITEELNVNDSLFATITLTNLADSALDISISSAQSIPLINSINPSSLSIQASGEESFEIKFNATNIQAGIYSDTILIDVINSSALISIPVEIRVLDGTESPIIELSPTAFTEVIEQFKVRSEELMITNTGNADLTFNISVDGDSLDQFTSNVKKTKNAIDKDGFISASYPYTEGSSKSALLKTESNQYTKIITSLYSTDFEDFTLGDVNGKNGWVSQFENNWVISDSNPFEGNLHFRGISDGLGADRPGSVLAISPTVVPGDEAFMVYSSRVNIQGEGVTWEIIPQSPAAGSVVTRLRFNGDGTISALVNPDFVSVDAEIPEGYFDLRIVVDKEDFTFSVYFDDEMVFSGQGFAGEIEQVVVLSAMETIGSSIDIDNFEIIDGDANSPFITVTPLEGIVPFGSSLTAEVRFDARSLLPGDYTATITINSNDTENAVVEVPVSLSVVQPAVISVNPDQITAAIDVAVDDPATATEIFTISNSGESTLEFSTALSGTTFTPAANTSSIKIADLDMSLYGVGNTAGSEEKSAGIKAKVLSTISSGSSEINALNNNTFSDSIAYDSGINFPDDFAGIQQGAYTSAIKFDVESSFNLTAIRNAFRTEAVSDPVVILEVYLGGDTPNAGELLTSQTFDQSSEEGVFALEELNESLSFEAGESFWVVHKYPDGIAFPQGVDDNIAQRPDTYFFSGDGGATFNPSGFVFLVRALSGSGSDNYISLSPASGIIAPGESLGVSATFDATTLANGLHETDILISSNDPINPSVAVATSLQVSGQTATIEVSDEYLLFNDVFIGQNRERTFSITNGGLAELNVSSISSDNADFSVSPASVNISPGGEQVVTVNFAPSQLGSINGIVSIETAGMQDPIEVVVNGIGAEPPFGQFDPEEVIESVDAGTIIEKTISLRNDGNAPLIYSFPDLALSSLLANPEVAFNNSELLTFDNAGLNEEKGIEDTRVGHEVLFNVGTDNDFGYSWIDSDEANGPVYNFTDITATGTEITTNVGGDGTAQVPLSFSFEFYGESYSSAFVNANGFIAFEAPAGFNTYTNSQIPTDDNVNNMIAGFWNDIEPQEFNGSVHYQDFGDKLIVQWTEATEYFGTANESVTFQIVLHEDGNIDIYYEDVESASFLNTTTVGIENADGSDGAQVAFNTSYIKDELAVRFIKPTMSLTPFITAVDDLSGVVPAGGSKDITVTLDATDLNDGRYFDQLIASTNAPSDSGTIALFDLTVVGFPEISFDSDSLNFEPIFVGLSSEASLLISNEGSKELLISSISNNNSDFQLDESGPISLQPNQSRIVNVTFAPSSVGSITDEIIVESNDVFGNESASIYLSGVGIDPPVINLSPDSLSVVVYEGDSATENVTIANAGAADLFYSLSVPFFGKAQAANSEVKQYEKLNFEKILSKETEDTRVGPEFLNASGGPGTFGYTWIDNNSGGPAYDYVDISESGQLASVGADGNTTVALPFEFNFFGSNENEVTIGANGFLTFDAVVGSNFVNAQIPDEANPNLFIAPMWSDLEPQNGGGVYYEATEDYFIVQYDSVPGFGFPPFLPIPDPVSFQVILYPNGQIKMQYENVASSLATSSTVGLEGPQGQSGLQVIFNNTYLTDNLAITFTPPIQGVLAAGESADIPITFFSEGLDAGETYLGDIIASSNDPISPELTVPVSLKVLTLPEISSFTLINAELSEEIGELFTGEIINLDNYANNEFSVLANPASMENVGSVVFDFNGEEGFQVENIAPYALGGDFNSGSSFYPVAFPMGINTITATPYTGNNGTGKVGTALTVEFEVIDNQPDFCYGESVTDFQPGNRKNGRTLPQSRSNPEKALGQPQENDNYNFVTLGFGGSITIELGCEVMDHEGNDLLIVETSFRDSDRSCGQYPEKAKVEASLDGENWVTIAEEICRDGEVDLANGGLTTAKYIRINDISNPDDFQGGNADGYDLDGIMIINNLGDQQDEELISEITKQENLIANEEDIEVRAFPNPVTDFINISLKGEGNEFHTRLYNIKGELMNHSTFSLRDGEEKGRLDLRKYPQGLYQLRVTNQTGGIVSQSRILKW